LIVADANLLCYLLIPGPRTNAAERAYARDRRWIAPRLYRSEVLNVLSNYCRFHGMKVEDAAAVWQKAIGIMRGFPQESDTLDVLRESVRLNLTTYDCEYVLLARRRSLKLVTADKKVLAAADDIAVGIEDFADGK